MSWTKHLAPGQILLGVKVPDKWVLLERMVDAVVHSKEVKGQPRITEETIRFGILEREREKSTAVGGGVAFPHARIPGFRGYVLCLATPKPPLEFDALDNRPVGIVCMIIVPEGRPTITLRIMAQLAKLLSDEGTRTLFTNATDVAELHGFLAHQTLELGLPITAKDIMRKPLADVYPETSLKDVTRTMHIHHLDAIEVIDANGALVGEITCDKLFKVGMPDFFSQLGSIRFIGEFDPFEKYFEEEAKSLARDVMDTSFSDRKSVV